jgi:hypothetical protein
VDVVEEQPDRAPRLEPSATDPDMWRALGQLTIYFALLEDQLRFSIWAFMGSEEQEPARIVVAGRPFAALVDMFCSLCHLRGMNPKRIDALRTDLTRVNEVRNRYVHSDWSVGRGPGSAMRSRHTAKAKEGLRFSFENVTAADIRALADDIARVATRVAWVEAPGDFMGLWPEEHK